VRPIHERDLQFGDLRGEKVNEMNFYNCETMRKNRKRTKKKDHVLQDIESTVRKYPHEEEHFQVHHYLLRNLLENSILYWKTQR
jgi:hypothetical protein